MSAWAIASIPAWGIAAPTLILGLFVLCVAVFAPSSGMSSAEDSRRRVLALLTSAGLLILSTVSAMLAAWMVS